MVEWLEDFKKGEGATSWIGTANQATVFFLGLRNLII